MTELNTDLLAQVEEKLLATLRDLGAPATPPLQLERPRDPSHGDVGLACFPFAKQLGKSPPDVAQELARRLQPDALLAGASAVGPFLNLRYDRAALARAVVGGALAGAAPWGRWPSNGKTVVIDFSSPNIAKPFHFGHLRSTVIGAALRRLYQHTGWNTVGINHLGDWGAQFGLVIAGWRRWGDEAALARSPMRHLFEVYVRVNAAAKEDKTIEHEADVAFQRLESGEDNEERRLWRRLRDVSLQAFAGPYRRLGVEFDAVTGESFYEDKMQAVVDELTRRGLAVLSEGALVVELEGMPPCILRKTDGTTIYATRDLAALFYRRATYGFDRALYVVGAEQRLHFKQLRAVIGKLGWPQAEEIEHVDFGLVLSKNAETGRWEKFTTRGGNAIFLDEVLDEAVAKIRTIIEQKNPELPGKDQVAEAIGTSAIVFNDLKNARVKDVKFDWDEMLSFEGETGPYVQYAHARLASILRKAGEEPSADVDYSLLADAGDVLLTMLEVGPTLRRAVDKNEPSLLTALTIRIASTIHSYLRDHHVLGAEPPVRKARLALVAAARRCLATCLGLLGVAAPDEM